MNRCLHLMVVLVFVAVSMAACTETQVVRDAAPQGDGTEQNSGSGAATPGAIPITPAVLPSAPPSGAPGTPPHDTPKSVLADIVKPEVITTNPKSGFTVVSPTSEITIQFSEAVKPSTLVAGTIQLTDSHGNTVAGALKCTDMTIDGASTCSDQAWPSVTLVPAAPLLDSEAYTLKLTTGIQDVAGNALRDDDLHNIITFKTDNLKTTKIAAGEFHILALKENGTLWAWGRNNSGQLGDGTNTDRSTPVRVMKNKVEPLTNVIAIAASGANGISFALVEDPDTKKTSVWGWGANDFGQMGSGVAGDDQLYATPITDTKFVDVTAIAAGKLSGYALRSDGTVMAWGDNWFGQLGDGTLDPASGWASSGANPPVQVHIPEGYIVKAIASSFHSVLAIVEDKETHVTSLAAWGYGFYGLMGNGTYYTNAIKNPNPILVKDSTGEAHLTGIAEISATMDTFMALTAEGDLYVWGNNFYRGVGDGTTANLRSRPVKVMENVTHIGSSGYSSFATTSSKSDANTGDLWGWGNNDYLQLLQSGSTMITSPTRIGTLDHVADVQSTSFSTVILKEDGSVITAGLNVLGQLGNNGITFHTHHPNLLQSVPASTQISGRMVVTKEAKTAMAWGRNVDCELGNPKQSMEVMTPALLNIPDPIKQVANSGIHMLALTEKGEVWAWGNNKKGQLGLGVAEVGKQHCTPQKIPGLSDVIYIAAGFTWLGPSTTDRYEGISMAIRKPTGDPYGEVLAWGYNGHAELGNNSTIDSPIPIRVQFPNVDGHYPEITQVAVSEHALAVRADGAMYAWGGNGKPLNGHGYLCNGGTTQVNAPVLVDLENVKQVAVGDFFSLILLKDGTVRSCGFNTYGSMGTGEGTTGISAATPQVVNYFCNDDPACKVEQIVAGGFMSFAITEDKHLWAWGNNQWGQLGVGDSINRTSPALVLLADGSPFDNVKEVSTYHSVTSSSNPVDSGVTTAIRTVGGVDVVYDWGFLNTPPTFLIWEGEPAFRGVPQTVNWP